MRRVWSAAAFGVAGFALLVGLGLWQLQRLAWKEGILGDLATRIAAVPVALPDVPDAIGHRYLPVTVSGRTTGEEVRILTSMPGPGPGYRIVAAFDTGTPADAPAMGATGRVGGELRQPMTAPFDVAGAGAAVPVARAQPLGRRIMVDLGYVPLADAAPRPATAMTVAGNLHWPDETDSFTPAPDRDRGIWFARDVPAMAAALDAEAVLVVAREIDRSVGTVPLPVMTDGIPNDHLNYAITWFTLAAIWAGMTTVAIRRMARGAGSAGG